MNRKGKSMQNQPIDSIISRVAKFLGVPHEKGKSPERMMTGSINQVLCQVPIASLLHYESYDEINGLYYNQGTIGFVLEVSPLIGATQETINILNNLIAQGIPAKAISQWLLWASPRIGQFLDNWANHRGQRGGYYEQIAKARSLHFKRGARTSLIKTNNYRLRDFKALISVNVPVHQNAVDELLTTKENIMHAFSAIGSEAVSVTPEVLLSLLYNLVNPDSGVDAEIKRWEHDRSLSAQIISTENHLTLAKTHLTLGNDTVVSTFSVEELPERWMQHDNAEVIGCEDNPHLQPLGEYFINAVIRGVPKEVAERKALLKTARARQLAESKLAKFMPRARKIYEDWQYANERLDSGDKFVEIFYQVVSYSPKDKVNAANNAILNLFSAMGWKIKRDLYIPLQSWLTLLPMRVDNALFDDLKTLNRTRMMMTVNAANLVPLQGEWKGVGAPNLLLFGRRGQMCWWDNFANKGGNYNVAVAGKSRSGKSVLLQDIATGVIGAGGRAFIFDIGRSFEKACKYFGGEFIEFKEDSDICINPFTDIRDFDEALEMLLPVFSIMASSQRHLTEIERSYLEKALKEVWLVYGQAGDVTKVAEWLSKQGDDRAKDVGTMLYAYTSQGRYGKYLNGQCTLDFSNPYIVLELEELKQKKDLQSVVLMLLMYHVTEYMYKGGRKQRILCIIDEAWDLMGGDLGAKFIEAGYRRAAKYNAAFISGTQSLEDYEANASARAAKANADTLLVLAQKPDVIERIVKSDMIDGNEHFKKQLRSIQVVDRQYSELMIKTSTGYSIHRLLLDPFSVTLYSSSGAVFAAVNDRVNQGIAMAEAVSQVTRLIEEGKL